MAGIKDATVVLTKCQKTGQTYGIRMEKRNDGIWYCTWAFKVNDQAAKNEKYASTSVSGIIKYDGEYPGCPYCGSHLWFECGACHQLNCYKNEERVHCQWCDTTSGCKTAERFDLSGRNL